MAITKPAGALLALVALAAALPAAGQYKYIDEKGATVYSDRPPPAGARSSGPIDLKGHAPADATAGLPYALAQAVRKAPVTLYTQTGCSPCDMARKLLVARGVPFAERTLTTREDLDAFHQLGFEDFLPAATVGGARLVNFSPEDWNAALDKGGYPRTSVLPRDWRNPAPAPLVAQAASVPANGAAQPPAEPAPDAPPPNNPPQPQTPPGFRF